MLSLFKLSSIMLTVIFVSHAQNITLFHSTSNLSYKQSLAFCKDRDMSLIQLNDTIQLLNVTLNKTTFFWIKDLPHCIMGALPNPNIIRHTVLLSYHKDKCRTKLIICKTKPNYHSKSSTGLLYVGIGIVAYITIILSLTAALWFINKRGGLLVLKRSPIIV